MKISFQIPYHTHWGEDVRVLLSDGMVHPLHTRNGEIWRGCLELDTTTSPAELSYQYAIFQDDVCIRKEWRKTAIDYKSGLCPTNSKRCLA